jgi:hypothetical protein
MILMKHRQNLLKQPFRNPWFSNNGMFMWRLIITIDNFDGTLFDEKDCSFTVIRSENWDALEPLEQMGLKGLWYFIF